MFNSEKTINFLHDFQMFYSDPSIEGDAPFRSCLSSDEIFCQEISNDPKTNTITDIKEQLHYNVWREVEKIYDSLKIMPHEAKGDLLSKEEL